MTKEKFTKILLESELPVTLWVAGNSEYLPTPFDPDPNVPGSVLPVEDGWETVGNDPNGKLQYNVKDGKSRIKKE